MHTRREERENPREIKVLIGFWFLIIQRDRSTALYGSTHSIELPYFRSSLIDPEQSAFS